MEICCSRMPSCTTRGYHLGEGRKCGKGERGAWQRGAAGAKGIRGSVGGESKGVCILVEKESRRRKGSREGRVWGRRAFFARKGAFYTASLNAQIYGFRWGEVGPDE